MKKMTMGIVPAAQRAALIMCAVAALATGCSKAGQSVLRVDVSTSPELTTSMYSVDVVVSDGGSTPLKTQTFGGPGVDGAIWLNRSMTTFYVPRCRGVSTVGPCRWSRPAGRGRC